MIATLNYVKAAFGHFVREERAQDAFEYLLVVGGVSVAIVLAIATPAGGAMATAVIDGTCTAISGVPGMGTLDCTP